MYSVINNYTAPPISTALLYKNADIIRTRLNVSKDSPFPIVELLENEIVLNVLCPSYSFEVVNDKELPPNVEATTDIDDKLIIVKESIYDRACNNDPHCLFTLAHELSHALLHSKNRLNRDSSKHKNAFVDPEWQANTMASALLIPIEYCNQYVDNYIMERYKVSYTAVKRARKNLSKI